MIEQPDLFKAILHIPAQADHGLAQCEVILRVMDYIDENNLHKHYVNMYANTQEVVIVFNNRNAAVMAKLATLL